MFITFLVLYRLDHLGQLALIIPTLLVTGPCTKFFAVVRLKIPGGMIADIP
jgi:hypothetical protein